MASYLDGKKAGVKDGKKGVELFDAITEEEYIKSPDEFKKGYDDGYKEGLCDRVFYNTYILPYPKNEKVSLVDKVLRFFKK